ncbi:Thioesterase/thiol ester dehydrase-isomerase [Xylariaceae sp. FL0255]|nr:Thioesterase/thiol ester dehydrase-isomerase [Xylariaceae sp. FL0255]
MPSKVKGLMDSAEGHEGIKRVEEYLKWGIEKYKEAPNADWSSQIIPYLAIISHSTKEPHPCLTIRLTIQPNHVNSLGNLHGGCSSTIFDICTTFVLQMISRPGFWQFGGVSRTLNVTYLRPVPAGTVVDVECEIVHAGQRLSALRGVVRKVNDDGSPGLVLALCEHNKVNTDPSPPKL